MERLTKRFSRVNLGKDEENDNNSIVKPASYQKSVFGNEPQESFKSLALHPKCFNNQNFYLFRVTKKDEIAIRKFKIVNGYSKTIKI